MLSAEDCTAIDKAIGEIEQRTAGELVVAWVPRSSAYAGPRALVAALWTVATAAAVWTLTTRLHPLVLFFAQIPLGLLYYKILDYGGLLRRIVPRTQQMHAVHRMAMQVFIDRGIHQTRDHSGLLLLVSEAEHQVEIMADAGIHARVGEHGWETHVQQVAQSIREGKAKDGIIEVLQDIGKVLAETFPPRPDDVNELPNHVVRPLQA